MTFAYQILERNANISLQQMADLGNYSVRVVQNNWSAGNRLLGSKTSTRAGNQVPAPKDEVAVGARWPAVWWQWRVLNEQFEPDDRFKINSD